MKSDVARRPSSAPPARSSGVESVESLVQRKKRAMAKDQRARDAAYAEWLQSINKASFQLPCAEIDTVEEREKKLEMKAKSGVHQLNQAATQYKRWIRETEHNHHDRIMVNVKAKLKADALFDRDREAAAAAQAQKVAEMKKESQKQAAESRKAIEAMYSRVRSQPLLIQQV